MHGRVTFRSRPQRGVRLMAVVGARLVAVAATDEDGAFTIDAPGGAALLVKAADEVVAVRWQRLDPAHPGVELDDPAHPLVVHAGNAPPGLDLELSPYDPPAVPPEAREWLTKADQLSAEPAMARRSLAGGPVEVLLQEGVWRLRATLAIPVRSRAPGARSVIWRTVRATLAGGGDLAPDGTGAFLLEHRGAQEVRLELRREEH